MIGLLLVASVTGIGLLAAEPPRCEVVPQADHQVAFRIDGREVTRWHYGAQYPRPFFYPFLSPDGVGLTRMGHPGAPDHDHHRSVWLAHYKLQGVDFWSDQTKARVRQKQWFAYADGNEAGVMAVLLGWYDPDGKELMEQEVVAAVRPLDRGEWALELQLTMRPGAGRNQLTLEKTNFGFLAVRVAKSVSAFFGDGVISDSEGRVGEPAIFGKQSRWMDYSGPVAVSEAGERRWQSAGITFLDHPRNPRYPTHWHVREDGWMGAAFGLAAHHEILRDHPLRLRYQLVSHRGAYQAQRAQAWADAFAGRPEWVVSRSKRRHHHFDVLPGSTEE